MKKLKDLTADEKNVHDSLDSPEAKKQYLEELKDDTTPPASDDANINNNNSDNTSDTTNNNSGIDDLHKQNAEELQKALENKEKRAEYQKSQAKKKQEEEPQDEDSSSVFFGAIVFAAFIGVGVYVAKYLGFIGGNATVTEKKTVSTTNGTTNLNDKPERQATTFEDIYNG